MVSDKIHCIDFNTEVLTKNGWKTIHQLTKNDLIATLENDKLVYEKPIDIMIYNDYEGPMYYINNSSVDFAVTGNHRMWVSKYDEKDNKWLPYNFERADNILGEKVKYKNNVDSYSTSKNIYKNKYTIDDVNILQISEFHNGNYYSINKNSEGLYELQKEKDETIIEANDCYTYKEKEKCPVFCLQVPSEVFYVRRNGKCAWTANSRSHGQYGLSNNKIIASESLYFCDIDKLREYLVKSLILTYFRNKIRVLVNH